MVCDVAPLRWLWSHGSECFRSDPAWQRQRFLPAPAHGNGHSCFNSVSSTRNSQLVYSGWSIDPLVRRHGLLRCGGEVKLVVQLKEVPAKRAIGKNSLHILEVVNADEESGVRTLELIGRRPDRLKSRDEKNCLPQADGLAEFGF